MIKNKTFISISDSENSSFFWAIPQLTQFPAHIQIIQIVIAVYSSMYNSAGRMEMADKSETNGNEQR